jgi:4-amino-4-deoxy-L-arabinose transferase-like glycosyltransferase
VATRTRTDLAPLVVLVAGAALLRFSTLGVQSLSNDEAFTVEIATGGLDSIWSSVRSTESTPPLYYYLAWAWEKPFGDGEAGMRLLPALLGTLLVPATWAAARELLPRRSALLAALLVAVSPLLVWYSQEARAYALFALLSTLGFLFFVRGLRSDGAGGGSRDILLWSLCSALAVATHWFAVFPVAAEGIWLLLARRDEPVRVLAACALPALTGAALLPLLLHQEEHVPRAWTEAFTLWDQLRGLVQQGAVGPRWTWLLHRPGVLAILALGAAAVALLVLRGNRRERRGAVIAAVVALAVMVPPAVISLFGDNIVATRNAIAAWPLAAIVAAAGLGAARARRAGALVAAALCAVMLAIDVAVPLDERLQRDDWEGLMVRVGPPEPGRAVAVLRGFENSRVAAYYLPGGGTPAKQPAVRVDRLVVVGDPRSTANALSVPPVGGLAFVDEARDGDLALARLRAEAPVELPAHGLYGTADLIVGERRR